MKPSTVISCCSVWRPNQSPLFRASSVAPPQKVQTEAGRSTREEAEGSVAYCGGICASRLFYWRPGANPCFVIYLRFAIPVITWILHKNSEDFFCYSLAASLHCQPTFDSPNCFRYPAFQNAHDVFLNLNTQRHVCFSLLNGQKNGKQTSRPMPALRK